VKHLTGDVHVYVDAGVVRVRFAVWRATADERFLHDAFRSGRVIALDFAASGKPKAANRPTWDPSAGTRIKGPAQVVARVVRSDRVVYVVRDVRGAWP